MYGQQVNLCGKSDYKSQLRYLGCNWDLAPICYWHCAQEISYTWLWHNQCKDLPYLSSHYGSVGRGSSIDQSCEQSRSNTWRLIPPSWSFWVPCLQFEVHLPMMPAMDLVFLPFVTYVLQFPNHLETLASCSSHLVWRVIWNYTWRTLDVHRRI